MVEPLSFKHSKERLDAIFGECTERKPTPFDDRVHLEVRGSPSQDRLEGALLALVGQEQLYLVDRYMERGANDVAHVSLYRPA